MRAILPRMLPEVVRLCPLAERGGAFVTVDMRDSEQSVSRARGSALYVVRLAFSWLPAWESVEVVDQAGEPVHQTFAAVAAWLSKSMAGFSLRLQIDFDAWRLSPEWGGVRALRHADYMAWLDGDGMGETAAALRAGVAGLPFDSGRRERVEGRAARIDGVALSLSELSGMPDPVAGAV